MSWRLSQALEKFNVEKDMAAFIKKEFDKKYSPTWHCIVGRNFGTSSALPDCCWRGFCCWQFRHLLTVVAFSGSYVTHETKHFIYFYLGTTYKSNRHFWMLVVLLMPDEALFPHGTLKHARFCAGQVAVLLFKSG